jgi:hypothetical protein
MVINTSRVAELKSQRHQGEYRKGCRSRHCVLAGDESYNLCSRSLLAPDDRHFNHGIGMGIRNVDQLFGFSTSSII